MNFGKGHSLPLPLVQYLERYLWAHFSGEAASEASAEHVLSMVYMVNEKFREGVSGWTALTPDEPRFAAFIKRRAARANPPPALRAALLLARRGLIRRSLFSPVPCGSHKEPQ